MQCIKVKNYQVALVRLQHIDKFLGLQSSPTKTMQVW